MYKSQDVCIKFFFKIKKIWLSYFFLFPLFQALNITHFSIKGGQKGINREKYFKIQK